MVLTYLAGEFTGKERDGETGLDNFLARYYSGAQGRFTSPDQPLIDQNPADPQSWNLYGYARNNPLTNLDPTGQSCVKTTVDGKDSVADDGDGKGCADACVKPSTQQQRDRGADITPQVVNVTGEKGSLWAFLIAPAVPRYVENDIPLNEKAQVVVHELSKKIDTYPTVCGGGVYFYYGKELVAGPVHGFAGTIAEFDSRAGGSKGALFEIGGGQGYVGGAGYIATTNAQGQPSSSGLVYGGIGGHTRIASASAGIVGFNSGVGLYGEMFGKQRGGGVGAYVNISSIGGCK
jgi:RHS repeat-associated protein